MSGGNWTRAGLCIGGPASGKIKSVDDCEFLAVPSIKRDAIPLSYGTPAATASMYEVFYYRFVAVDNQGIWTPTRWSIAEMFAFIAGELERLNAVRKSAEDLDVEAVWAVITKMAAENGRQ